MVVKTKKAKGTNSMPEKENLILKITKTVQKALNLIQNMPSRKK